MKKSRAGAWAVFIGTSALAVAAPPPQLPPLPEVRFTPSVTIPEMLAERRDVAVRTLQSQVPSLPPPSHGFFRCGCHAAAMQMPEFIDQAGYIKMLAEALKGSSAIDIFYGERREKVYSSDDNTAICAVFGFLTGVVTPESEAYVELADERLDSNSYIIQTNFIPTCVFVFNGEKPASVQIDLERKSLVISAEKTWGVFHLDEATCEWVELFVRASVLSAVKAAHVARR